MRLSSRQYAEALLQTDASDPKRVVSAFLSFARKNRAMKKLSEIVRIAEKLDRDREGRLALVVETAHETNEAARTEIERIAAREFPEAKLSFVYRIRSELLGGMRLSSDEAVFDATIRRRLRELESQVKNGESGI